MAETEKQDEPTLPTKRKAAEEDEQQNPSRKTPKLDTSPPLTSLQESNRNGVAEEPLSEDEEEDDEDDDYEGEEEEPVVVDRKGKGIMIEEDVDDDDDTDDDDDEEDDESNDSGEYGVDGGDGDDGSEPEEDPLAEVDLDNILPSRTRRRSSKLGVRIKDVGTNGKDNENDG